VTKKIRNFKWQLDLADDVVFVDESRMRVDQKLVVEMNFGGKSF
jgi:hypothetical protein